MQLKDLNKYKYQSAEYVSHECNPNMNLEYRPTGYHSMQNLKKIDTYFMMMNFVQNCKQISQQIWVLFLDIAICFQSNSIDYLFDNTML